MHGQLHYIGLYKIILIIINEPIVMIIVFICMILMGYALVAKAMSVFIDNN